ncbi:hypothetical protein [Janthinobacterium sp. TND4EL3]|uniref:hypothetical protein n=1 Tax=Janthinobacterium sp. TND4EL3 TaxID=1907311 RepID=UPI001115A898|nr:hypothetical protein [Janthinobacterium sp. TND4EL3]
MSDTKPKSRRRVAPHGEEAMRTYSIRLTKAQYEYAKEVGEGNFSLGMRRIIEAYDESIPLQRTTVERGGLRLPTKCIVRKRPTGKSRGRPALPASIIQTAQRMYSEQGLPVNEIVTTLNIHISTFYKYVNVRKKQ